MVPNLDLYEHIITTWNELLLLINLMGAGGDPICYMCNCFNKNQFFVVKILKQFKPKLIPSNHKDHVNDWNLKPV